jgi:putative intracellular protease/amidase
MAAAEPTVSAKILLVFTNHSDMGDTGKKTGWWLSEASHPHAVFKKAGVEVTFVSAKGGKAAVDPVSYETHYKDEDAESKAFADEFLDEDKCIATVAIGDVDASEFDGIFYVGGHGTMWDFRESEGLRSAAEKIYHSKGGVVGAVCHGPAGLLSLKATEGGGDDADALIKGKKVVGFSNPEESTMKLEKVVPYSLEDEVTKLGGVFSGGDMWADVSVRDGRVITGQNPGSAGSSAKLFVEALIEMKKE